MYWLTTRRKSFKHVDQSIFVYYEHSTACKILFFSRYIDDDILFYLNNNNSLDLPVNCPDDFNFCENGIV